MAPSRDSELSPAFLLFLAAACGLTVANLYYNQPLLTQVQAEFGVGIETVGRVPMLTQLGYAGGMLLLTPLGDQVNRRTLILLSSFVVCGALLLAALAPTFLVFELASLLIGLTAVGAQVIIPHVAHLTPDSRRGAAVGKVFTGLLLGILLARTFSGWVGGHFGWRPVFALSASLMFLLSLCYLRLLPGSEPTFRGSYPALLASIFRLVREERVLRHCAFIGACIFAAFSAPWATLIFLLAAPPFGLGPEAVGWFGLLGAAGALAANFTGRVADRRGPLYTSRLGLSVAGLSFLGLALAGSSLAALALGFFVMDAGVQSAHVSNQARFFRIRPDARSRLNTAYMFFYFVGGAFGSYAGSLAFKLAGWPGVCLFSAACASLAALRAWWPEPAVEPTGAPSLSS